MIEQKKLILKSQNIQFTFNEMTSAFETNVQIQNLSSQTLFLKFYSSFGSLLKFKMSPFDQESSFSEESVNLQPSKGIFLYLKIQITNQIKKNSQKIKIVYSQNQKFLNFNIQSLTSFLTPSIIKFPSELPDEDAMLNEILITDCKQLCEQAEEVFKHGLIMKSLHKYEQAFLLYRQHYGSLYGMSECYYLMEKWNEALLAIQTALLGENNHSYEWMKTKILFEMWKQDPQHLQIIRQLKKRLQNTVKIEEYEMKKNQMLSALNAKQTEITSTKGGKLLYDFLQNVTKKFTSSEELQALYEGDKAKFEQQLNDILGFNKEKTSHTLQETPECILDPITYEIMNEPLIVPSGHSYQQKSLKNYLNTHGNVDLYTKKQLYIQWARPNHALKKYISQNTHLSKWLEYEKQISRFH